MLYSNVLTARDRLDYTWLQVATGTRSGDGDDGWILLLPVLYWLYEVSARAIRAQRSGPGVRP